MKYYLAVISELATAQQCDSITDFIKERRWGFWHHIGNLWAIAIDDDGWNAASLRDKILEYAPGCITLVIQFDSSDWAAMSPSSSHPWLHQHLSGVTRTPLFGGIAEGWDKAAPE